MQAALIRRSDNVSDADMAFAVKAVNKQGFEFARDWSMDPQPLAFYSREVGFPDGQFHVMSVVDDVSMAGVIGFHDSWAGVVSAQAKAMGARTSIVIGHEHLEMKRNPKLNRWRRMPDGRETAEEVCDAVQVDTYPERVSIFGEVREIWLPNYLLPSWFDVNGKYPFDRMGKLRAPFSMTEGGYMIVRGADRRISNVFASGLPPGFEDKLMDPVSRLNLIKAG